LTAISAAALFMRHDQLVGLLAHAGQPQTALHAPDAIRAAESSPSHCRGNRQTPPSWLHRLARGLDQGRP
jgi:hypothetical protein